MKVAIAFGDGIGPEIMDATLSILKEVVKNKLSFSSIEIGESQYKKGYKSGIPPEAWDILRDTKILLKAPITTPQGGGYKSLNVTIRKTLGLFANVRPCVSYFPYVETKFPKLDIIIVRENEEDLYAGIEYWHTKDTVESKKIYSVPGCEKINRFAFEYAMKNNRKKVTCLSKDNIMKASDGLFHKIFDEVAKDYPSIENTHMIIDIGAARLAAKPEGFDVVVTSNLYGDIVSDIVAEVAGSVGLAPSANIGEKYAMFEAIHGSAPDIAGQNIANPSGLLQAAVMMLVHLGLNEDATIIQNALLKTIEDGFHTKDKSKELVGTKEFAKAVIARLGKKPSSLQVVDFGKSSQDKKGLKPTNFLQTRAEKRVVGFDIFVDYNTKDPKVLADKIQKISDRGLGLQMISSRGLTVWPASGEEVDIAVTHWRLRFVPKNSEKVTSHDELIYLLGKLQENNIDFTTVECLYAFGDEAGFSLGQGE